MAELYPLITTARLRITVDGEGVTTLVAGAGCPLECKYCINERTLQKPPTLVTAQELYDKVKCDDLYFVATGGGVTFGGGEALLHASFIREFRALCKSRWRIYAETSLNVAEENMRIAAECVDGFIVDIKDLNPEIYCAYTGAENARVLENLKLLISIVGAENISVRVPLIPNFNTPDDQKKSIEALKKLGIKRLDPFSYIVR